MLYATIFTLQVEQFPGYHREYFLLSGTVTSRSRKTQGVLFVFVASLKPFGLPSSRNPPFPACFRGRKRQIDVLLQSTFLTLFVPVEICYPA